jgi:hypothetical protein
LKWYEPSGYADWRYNKRGGSPSLLKIIVALVLLTMCIVSYMTLSFEYRFENDIHVLEMFVGLGVLGFFGIHIYAWFNSKFDFITTQVEVQDTCIYRYNVNSNDVNEPEIFLNEIESFVFKLIKWKEFEFYNCHIKLKPLRSKRRDYFEFGIQKGFFDENYEKLTKMFDGNISADKLMSAPFKD